MILCEKRGERRAIFGLYLFIFVRWTEKLYATVKKAFVCYILYWKEIVNLNLHQLKLIIYQRFAAVSCNLIDKHTHKISSVNKTCYMWQQ